MNLLGYLNDHLAAAAAGIQLAERCRDRDPESSLAHVLQALLVEIRHDREVLERVIRALGGSPGTIKRATALGAERISSLRMWLPMIGPGSQESARLEEIELLSLGIEGKRLMWAALAQLSSTDERLSGFDSPRKRSVSRRWRRCGRPRSASRLGAHPMERSARVGIRAGRAG
jgi:hypothetical protein